MFYLSNESLEEERREVLLEVIQESLRIKYKADLFNWLQRGFQYLIGHEIFVYGVRSFEKEKFEFNYFTLTPSFSDTKFKVITEEGAGLVYEAYKTWQINNMPVFSTSDLPSKEYENYSVLNISNIDMQTPDLNHLVTHGFCDNNTSISTLVIYGGINAPINNVTSCLLQLLMPSIHCALVKVHANSFDRRSYVNQNAIENPITKRELEVLRWVYKGKTNWEISSILGISHTTVKNHVQNIIRKLGVENRRQAAIKGLSLGFMTNN